MGIVYDIMHGKLHTIYYEKVMGVSRSQGGRYTYIRYMYTYVHADTHTHTHTHTCTDTHTHTFNIKS
jgi:hypothetical protein